MDEPHSGLSHDLPEYRPNDPPQIVWRRVKVFKATDFRGQPCWTWEHQCSWKPTKTDGLPYRTQEIAFFYGMNHARRCL